MAIATTAIEYDHNGTTLEAIMAFDDAVSGPRPGVLVGHAWAGRCQFSVDTAKHLASLGYVGFALDLYGKGVLGQSVEQNQKLMQPFIDDRAMLQNRLSTALAVMSQQEQVDPAKTGMIGFCFGGLCALDMARSNADLLGVASFHGLFMPPGNTEGAKISAKVLALHGYDDPMATPDQMTALADELTKADADWQINAYGGVMHAFTNPEANDPSFGTVYNAAATRRAWTVTEDFLQECFS
ncbi:MAG: dienelactone hydrolase family protein [Pseudomonadota bacterium]